MATVIPVNGAAELGECNAADNGTLDIDLGPNTTLLINENTDLSNLTLSITQALPIVVNDGCTLTLTAAQADGLSITDEGVSGDNAKVTVSAFEAVPGADLSGIAVTHAVTHSCAGYDYDEVALLDAEGGVTVTGNLGSDMVVEVSDADDAVGSADTMTFTGTMDSASTNASVVKQCWANRLPSMLYPKATNRDVLKLV